MDVQPPIPGTLGDPVSPDAIVAPRLNVWAEIHAHLVEAARSRRGGPPIPEPPPLNLAHAPARWMKWRWLETLAWANRYDLTSAIRELYEGEVILFDEDPPAGPPVPLGSFVCPWPFAWDEIYQRLVREREARGDREVPEPPMPLILEGWYSSERDKRERWRDLVAWAKRFGFIHAIPYLFDEDVYRSEPQPLAPGEEPAIGLVCPQPDLWQEICWRVDAAWIAHGDEQIPRPPGPLLLSGWTVSSWAERRDQWLKLLRWADDYGFRDLIPDFREEDVVRAPEPQGL